MTEEQQRSQQQHTAHNEDHLSCPICLQPLSCAVETSCGHSFCAECLDNYWMSLPSRSPKVCPLDRQVTSFVVSSITLRNITRSQHPERRGNFDPAYCIEMDAKMRTWNTNVLRKQRGVQGALSEDVSLIRRLFTASVIGKLMVFMLILVMILVTLLDLDLIPDSWPIIGFLDDIFLWIFVFHMVAQFYLVFLRAHGS